MKQSEWISKSKNTPEKLSFLTSLPGIGSYSARATLLYGLREYSVAFVDVYIRKLLHFFFGLDSKISEKKIFHFLDENFAPFQGLTIDWLSAIFPLANQSDEFQIKLA